MRKTTRKRSERGFVESFETLGIITVVVLGLIVGVVSLRDSIVVELSDLSDVFGSQSQTYETLGTSATGAAGAAGSQWQDDFDTVNPLMDYNNGDASAEINFLTLTSPG